MIDGRTIKQPASDDARATGEGFVSIRCRAMDTSLGRWTRTDPLGYVDGPNTYEALASNPAQRTDPVGLMTIAQDGKAGSASTSPFSPSSGAPLGRGPSGSEIKGCRVRTRLSYPHAGIEIDAGDAGGFVVDGSGGTNSILISGVKIGTPRGVRGPWKTLTPEQCKCLLGADGSDPARTNDDRVPEGAMPNRVVDDSTLANWRRRANNYPYTFFPPWNSNWSLKCLMQWCGLKVKWKMFVPGWDTPCPERPERPKDECKGER